jgi:dihydroorotase
MKIKLKGIRIFSNGTIRKCDLLIAEGIVKDISPSTVDKGNIYNFNGCIVTPGLIDVHVHFREPGFFYKEGILTGTKAAAHGGYTTVCTMPNLNPVPDSKQNLDVQLEAIYKDACIKVYPYGSITKGQNGVELSDMEEMSDSVIAFSDDGKGLQSDELMQSAMLKAKSLNKIIVAHCEDNSLLNGGYIHDGEYAKLHSHKGINSASEWKQIERDLKLVKVTNCAYHICHISTKESVNLIRKAKSEGLNVTCETAPHYLIFNDMDLVDDGKFKMNPPIRSEEDRLALIEGIKDGTIDMISTDHAPHSKEEKTKGLKDSLMGVVGLETSFAVLYTNLVLKGIIPLEKLFSLMQYNQANRFNIGSEIKVGDKADLAIFDLENKYKIDTDNFFSKGKSTPFEGMEVYGECLLTMSDGKIVYQKKDNSLANIMEI